MLKVEYRPIILIICLIAIVVSTELVGSAMAIPWDYHAGQVVLIDPTQSLQDTGIDLAENGCYYIRYHGWWSSSGGNYPERSDSYHDLRGRLWARVGSGDAFKLSGGEGREAFVSDASGRLYLFVEDIDNRDNLGSGVAIVYTLVAPEEVVSVINDSDPVIPDEMPESFFDVSVHPNPFNPQTSVSFDLNRPGRVEVGVFDLSGRHIATLANGQCGAGINTIPWDGNDSDGKPVASGVYSVRIKSEQGFQVKKMTLVR